MRSRPAAGERWCSPPMWPRPTTSRVPRSVWSPSCGDIDVWVNCAMTTIFAPVTTIDTAEFERATRVTYLGQVHGTLAALRRMRTRDRGVIVSVGSALAFRSIALQSAYCGAKFACRGFHDSVRVELRRDGSAIRVCQVHLPALDTPSSAGAATCSGAAPMPVPPIYEPSVAADAIVGVVDRPRRQRVVGGWNHFDHPRQQGRARCARSLRGAHHVGRSAHRRARRIRRSPGTSTSHSTARRGRSGCPRPLRSQAHGVMSPSFLRTLPGIVLDATTASFARAA